MSFILSTRQRVILQLNNRLARLSRLERPRAQHSPCTGVRGSCQKRLDNSVRRSSLQISAGNDAAEDESNLCCRQGKSVYFTSLMPLFFFLCS